MTLACFCLKQCNFFIFVCSDDEGNNTWPEILKFLFDCASSGNVELKESALIIFRWLIYCYFFLANSVNVKEKMLHVPAK